MIGRNLSLSKLKTLRFKGVARVWVAEILSRISPTSRNWSLALFDDSEHLRKNGAISYLLLCSRFDSVSEHQERPMLLCEFVCAER